MDWVTCDIIAQNVKLQHQCLSDGTWLILKMETHDRSIVSHLLYNDKDVNFDPLENNVKLNLKIAANVE